MSKSLIITEKPSVAGDIAKAVGGFKKGKDFYENEKFLISWAVGHLFELAVPASMKKQDKWDMKKLPIMPPEFELAPAEKMGSRVNVLRKLIKDKNVSDIINACDAGREGELIFRYIIQYTGTKKPIKRLWLQSMTPQAIREGFARLRTDAEMQPLASAARSRNEADWLVGINATRAFTLRLSGGRGSTVTSLGRVQTPTLTIIVDRERKIQEFKSRELHEITGKFRAAAGEYAGRWFDEAFRKDETEVERTQRLLAHLQLTPRDAEQRLDPANGSLWEEHRTAARLWHREIAAAIQQRCSGKDGIVELEEKKPASQVAPQLYDLTTLQREANNRFGFSAKRTLQIAQALYEKHKAITYPRTDSRALPEDYLPTVKSTLASIDDPFARKALDNNWVRPNKRIFNDTKVGDHFAIIPTGTISHSLDDYEQKLFDMVTKRFVAVFFPAAQYENTTRITRVEGEPFKTEGKILVAAGWLEVYGRDAAADKPEENLPAVSQGERVATIAVEIKTDQTKPPARYTEATILSAMESAGKFVEDEELRDAMKEKGLGTPATRASIIETLISAHYLTRQGKELQPTAKAIQTITLLKNAVPELTSPELTGEWEFRLREIEHRKLTRDAFMRDIRHLTEEIVGKAKHFHPDEHMPDSEPFGTCPKCGSPIIERFKSFTCSNKECDFTIWKTIAGRLLSREEFETLLRDKHVGPLNGFRSRKGSRFPAVLKLSDDFKAEFDFGPNGQENGAGQPVDFSEQQPLGKCPKCGGRVFELGMSYICENSVGVNKTCDFRAGKVILQQTVDHDQLKKLLNVGKTDLLPRFISRKGRPFKAFLVLTDKKDVGFEFEKREPKAKKERKPKEPVAKIDFSGQEGLGKCPKCGGKIFETENSYICEHSQAERKSCKFKLSKTILGKDIPKDQAQKLLVTGKTDLLDGFISKRGRPFSAYLKWEDGKVGFEFPERPARDEQSKESTVS
ncbi:MAG TPA: DNA topoisomerase 3 [Candidatus Udaeobacter sp.]|jgi:DNA topoisomerase-3|nr:DNA topoisomerase 3 [Candidatus Udaeobacter sp.]